jgi:hypothetical protein
VRIVGRNDGDPGGARYAWPAARFIARFQGTDAVLRLSHEDGFGGGPSYYDVIVDGTVTGKITVTGGATDYPIATGLATGVHVVEVFKRTEAAYGVDRYLGFTFPNGGTLLAPPATSGRKMEFIGDSMIQGYGIEGAGPDCGMTMPDVHNARLSMQQRTATALNADFTSTTYSGKGLSKNEDPGDNQTFPLLYPRALPENNGSTWTFSNYVPDVIVSVVGGTDFSRPPYPTAVTFATTYETWLTQLRTANPTSTIIAAVGGQLYDGDPADVNTRTIAKAGITTAVANRNAAGDAKVFMFEFTQPAFNQLTACDYHGSPAVHQQWADDIVPFLKTKLGW